MTGLTATKLQSVGRKAAEIDLRVGQRIRLRRTLLGVKQDELAAALGLSFQQLQKYESGQSRMSASRLHDIGKILDAPMSWFLESSDGPETTESVYEGQIGGETPDAKPSDTLELKRDTLEVVRLFEGLSNNRQRRLVVKILRAISSGDE